MTRAIWVTDPHFNFISTPDVGLFAAEIASQEAEMVIITGDIAEAPSLEGYLQILEEISIVPVHFVLGNHDFYGSSMVDMWMRTRSGSNARQRVKWLTDNDEPVRVNDTTALLGEDGWYDGRNGDYWGSTVGLADFDWIEDFQDRDRMVRLQKFQYLADTSAKRAKTKLIKAFDEQGYKKVVFLTHVPPYAQAAWHMGKMSGSHWLPYFSNKVLGDTFNEVMDARPDKELLVLCGHSHSPGIYDPRPNIQVETGGARYGRPAWRLRVI